MQSPFMRLWNKFLSLSVVCLCLLLPCASQAAAPDSKSDNKLEHEFFEAVSLLGDNEFSKASENFSRLKIQAAEQGFENLSSFSLTLLERTEVLLSSHEREKAGFVLRWARDLSPGDARVLLGVARFSELLSFGERLSVGLTGFWLSLFSPVIATTLSVNCMLIGLTSLTLALLFVSVLQLAKRGDLLFQVVGKYLSLNSRGAFGPLAVLAVLLLPAFLGVLFALVCWTLLLAKIFAPGKRLAVCAGLLSLMWGLALPVLNVSLGNSSSKLAWILEAQRIRSFVPHSSEFLLDSAKRNTDTIVKFGLAQSLFQEGHREEAKTLYTQLLGQVSSESSYGRVLRFHLASVALAEQQFAQARSEYEKLEEELSKSFELNYNLSLARLGELDTEGHRKYYELARDIDSTRLARLETDAKERPFPLLVSPPATEFLPFLLKLHALKDQRSGDKPFGKAGRVASALVIGASPAFLVVLGVCVFVCAWIIRPMFPNLGTELSANQNSWRFIPGGAFFAECAPMTGAVILALFLGLLLAATETPIHLVPIVPLSRSASGVFYSAAGLVFLGYLLWTNISFKLRKH